MGKKLKKFVAFAACTTAGIYCINRFIHYKATAKNLLQTKHGKYYSWKNGDIYYTVHGSGSPVLLVHELNPSASNTEWSAMVKKLEKHHTVYAIDLLGCGRSDKPAITYTNYLFVQLLTDFVKQIIKEKVVLVATGASSSFSIMADVMNPEYFDKVILINPERPTTPMPQPDKLQLLKKHILDCPVFGTLLYNIKMQKKNISKNFYQKYYFKSSNVSRLLTDIYFEAAHIGSGKGRHLLSSMEADYTNINVAHVIPKLSNLCIIGSKNCPANMNIINSYVKANKNIETIYLSHSKYLPQLEAPEKLYEAIKTLCSTSEQAK